MSFETDTPLALGHVDETVFATLVAIDALCEAYLYDVLINTSFLSMAGFELID